MTFPDAVLSARRAAGLSQAAAGARCGLSQVNISQIERGIRLPSLPVYARIVTVLGLEPGVGIRELAAEQDSRA
jgi:transcriptional regulator with XRE-family HTH domain